MEQRTQIAELLDMMIQPGFGVREGTVAQVNAAARKLLVEPGQTVRDLLETGAEEYARFTGGCLYLRLKLGNRGRGAAVIRMDDSDIFLLDPEPENSELNALALASQVLRSPLSSVMIAADHLAAAAASSGDPEAREEAARLDRGLDQLLRIVNNMSDALLYGDMCRKELRSVPRLFDEIFEKARTLLARAGLELSYQGLQEDIYAPIDDEQLERAVLNILSNAAKYTPEGGRITASLSRQKQLLRLSIEDSGPGIREDVLSRIFHRYLRSPGIEDFRSGLGLGMVLIRTAAANHGGTVLIDQPEGARITMTLSLEGMDQARLRSPLLQVDYAGGHDHALIELSEILPQELYERN